MPNVFNIGGDNSFDRDNINQPQKPIADQPGYKPLRDVVKRTLAEMGETGMHKFALYKSYGIDFLRDYFTMVGASRNVKTRELEVDSLKRVTLPDDYIDTVKIGVRVGDHVEVFLHDEELALYTDTSECGVNQPNPSTHSQEDEASFDYSNGSWFSNPLNSYGEHTGGFYGYGASKIKNSFTIDNGAIQLSSNITCETIYIEYISSDIIYGEDTFVPIIAEEACKSYIKWKFESDRRQPVEYIVNRRQREYSNNIKLAKRRLKPLTVEDIIHATRAAFNMNFKS